MLIVSRILSSGARVFLISIYTKKKEADRRSQENQKQPPFI